MVAILDQRGVTTTVAANGIEALELLQTRSFDLIFMDIEMPGLDGIATTERIRQRESTHGDKRHRIVGLSAHAFYEDRNSALQAGMDDYLTKPIDIAELDRVLPGAVGNEASLLSFSMNE